MNQAGGGSKGVVGTQYQSQYTPQTFNSAKYSGSGNHDFKGNYHNSSSQTTLTKSGNPSGKEDSLPATSYRRSLVRIFKRNLTCEPTVNLYYFHIFPKNRFFWSAICNEARVQNKSCFDFWIFTIWWPDYSVIWSWWR